MPFGLLQFFAEINVEGGQTLRQKRREGLRWPSRRLEGPDRYGMEPSRAMRRSTLFVNVPTVQAHPAAFCMALQG